MPRKSAHHRQGFSKSTVARYRAEGLDIFGPDGNVDPVKFRQVKKEKQSRGQFGTSRDEDSRYWDRRFRRAKAKRAEQELAEAEGRLVSREAVVREWRARVVGLRTLLVGFGREIAPRVIGKSAREVQALVDVRMFEILRTFAHQEYQPERELEELHR